MTPKAGCGIGLFAKTPKTRKKFKIQVFSPPGIGVSAMANRENAVALLKPRNPE
jgi:hypothetical protein